MIWIAVVLSAVGAGWLLGHGDLSSNTQAAATAAPESLLTVLLGITAGLYGRDRVRLRRTYSSPSLAYAGKLILFASLSAAAAATFAPVDWPLGRLPLSAGGVAAGIAIWLGNLPTRL